MVSLLLLIGFIGSEREAFAAVAVVHPKNKRSSFVGLELNLKMKSSSVINH